MAGLDNIGKGSVFLVRHPTTALNNPADERVRSWGDQPLNAKGKQEIKQDAAQLKDKGITHVYHSDMVRARQAGKALASSLGVPCIETPALRPVNWGDLEGKKVADVKGKISDLIRHPNRPAPNGEKYNSFLSRDKKFTAEMQGEAESGETPAVISHGSHMLALDHVLSGTKVKPAPSSKVGEPPGSIIQLAKNGDKWTRKDIYKPSGKGGLHNIRS